MVYSETVQSKVDKLANLMAYQLLNLNHRGQGNSLCNIESEVNSFTWAHIILGTQMLINSSVQMEFVPK